MNFRKYWNNLVSVCGSAPEPPGVEQPNHETSEKHRRQRENRTSCVRRFLTGSVLSVFWNWPLVKVWQICAAHTHTHTHTHAHTEFFVVCSGTGGWDEPHDHTWEDDRSSRGCDTVVLHRSHIQSTSTRRHTKEKCWKKWKQNKTTCSTSESQTQKQAAGLRMWSVSSPPSILLLNIKHAD